MSREHILNGVYVCESGTRSETLAPSVYVNETVAAATVVSRAAFSTPQAGGTVYTEMIAY